LQLCRSVKHAFRLGSLSGKHAFGLVSQQQS
jgi:hypothetical protein